MEHDNLRIEIGGTEVEERFYRDLIVLEVELDDELAGMFRMTVGLLRADGQWPYLDEEPFTPWSRVVITAGLQNDSRATGRRLHHPPVAGVRCGSGAVSAADLGHGRERHDGS